MQHEGKQQKEAQSPQSVPLGTKNTTVSISQSAFCLVYMGQIVINVPRLVPARPPLHQPGWTHCAFVLLVGGFGLWSAWWLSQFGVAHASNPKWLVPIGLFGVQVLLSLALLEWGIFRPMRAAKAAGIRG